MSLTHASRDIFEGSAAQERVYRPFGAAVALAVTARDRIGGLVAAMRHGAEMRRLDRFSDHTLQDIGFERDWDGTLIKRQQ